MQGLDREAIALLELGKSGSFLQSQMLIDQFPGLIRSIQAEIPPQPQSNEKVWEDFEELANIVHQIDHAAIIYQQATRTTLAVTIGTRRITISTLPNITESATESTILTTKIVDFIQKLDQDNQRKMPIFLEIKPWKMSDVRKELIQKNIRTLERLSALENFKLEQITQIFTLQRNSMILNNAWTKYINDMEQEMEQVFHDPSRKVTRHRKSMKISAKSALTKPPAGILPFDRVTFSQLPDPNNSTSENSPGSPIIAISQVNRASTVQERLERRRGTHLADPPFQGAPNSGAKSRVETPRYAPDRSRAWIQNSSPDIGRQSPTRNRQAGMHIEDDVIKSEHIQRLSTNSGFPRQASAPSSSSLKDAAGQNSDWLCALRNAWQEEIDTMSTTKKAWYRDVNAIPLLKPSQKKKKQTTLQKEKILKILLRHIDHFQKEFLNCGSLLRMLRLKEKDLRATAKQELTKYATWHAPLIVRAYRAFALASLALLRIQMEYEDRKSLMIHRTIQKAKTAVTVIESAATEKALSKSRNLLSLDDISSAPELIELRKDIKLRTKFKKQRKQLFMNLLKRQPIVTSLESRMLSMRKIMDNTIAHPVITTFHELLDEFQDEFDSIILDQRNRNGMRILRLYEAIQATEIDEIPPYEIVNFLQEFVDQLATEYSLGDECLDRIRLYVGRSVFPILYPLLSQLKSDENNKQDKIFIDQVTWLRKLPPAGLDPILGKLVGAAGDTSAFTPIISLIEDVMYRTTPSDMLMVLYETMEMIHGVAKRVLGGDLGADDLFPVWLYCTIHANLVSVHSHMCFMENFAAPEESMTQLGYCLTTFQACVAHICTVSKESLSF